MKSVSGDTAPDHPTDHVVQGDRGAVLDAVRGAGADWLPFTTLTDRQRGIHYGTADEQTAGEVIWTQETEPIGLWAIHEPAAAVLSAARCLTVVSPSAHRAVVGWACLI